MLMTCVVIYVRKQSRVGAPDGGGGDQREGTTEQLPRALPLVAAITV